MMGKKIEAVFLDTGNTLRVVAKDATFQNHAQQELVNLLGVNEVPAVFCKQLSERYQAYKKWTKESLIEPKEMELWTRWMLPESPAEKIAPLASQLTHLWIDQNGRRVARPDAKQTIIELDKRGYTLGIIANTISPTEIPEWLEKNGLSQYFKSVILSYVFGRRKPDPYVFIEAARVAGVDPAKCAYVGDNPSRDIGGTRQAGFGMTIILLENATLVKEPPKGRERPDALIRECKDLLNIFPPR
jgi:putative hydrolase of the HAD superfamily